MGNKVNKIMAVITTNPHRAAGGVPIFLAKNDQELQQISFALEKIIEGTAHQILPEMMIIVRHS